MSSSMEVLVTFWYIPVAGDFTNLCIKRHHCQDGLQPDAPLVVLVIAGL